MKKERKYVLRNENVNEFMKYANANAILAFITSQDETHTTFACYMTDMETQKAKSFCESVRKRKEKEEPKVALVHVVHIIIL